MRQPIKPAHDKKKNSRKQYLIDKRFQFKYIGLLFVFIIFFNGILLGAAYFSLKAPAYLGVSENYIISQVSRDLNLTGHDNAMIISSAIKEYRTYERDIFWRVALLKMLPCLLFLLFLAYAAGLFISHKIAGPLYGIRKSLEKIKSGDAAHRIKLRKGDEFHDLAHDINNCLNMQQDTFTTIRIKTSSIEKAVKNVSTNIPPKTIAALQKDIAAITKECANYRVD